MPHYLLGHLYMPRDLNFDWLILFHIDIEG